MFVVYGVIIFLASGIGAFLGGGSGVIIKPLLTLLVDDTTEVINFISSVSVFAMSCSSTVKHLRAKTKVDFKTVLLISAGSILGGFAGKHIFDLFNRLLSDNLAMAYQAVLLACLLAVAMVCEQGQKELSLKEPHHHSSGWRRAGHSVQLPGHWRRAHQYYVLPAVLLYEHEGSHCVQRGRHLL